MNDPRISSPLPSLGLLLRFSGPAGSEVVLSASGEIDEITVPHLDAVVASVIEGRATVVVLELGEITSIGDDGIRIIANGAQRLASSGGRMVLRAPSALLDRMLDATGLESLIEMEELEENFTGADAELPTGNSDVSTITDGVTRRLHRMSAIQGTNDVVDGALDLVVALAQLIVQGADGVSVTLSRGGHLVTVAASDGTVRSMDGHQYAIGQGPCVDAAMKGRVFHADSLKQENRWSTFVDKALGLGINSILSTPLIPTDRPVGAINMYSRSPEVFSDREQELAAALAVETAQMIKTAADVGQYEDLAGPLASSLRIRESIAQAQGILMDRETLSAGEAYAELRRFSVSQGRPLAALAAEVVASTQSRSRRTDS